MCPIKDIGGTKARIYRIERRVVQAKTQPIDSRTTFRVIAAVSAMKVDDKSKRAKGACDHPGGCSIAHDSDCTATTGGANDTTSGVGSSQRDGSSNGNGRPRCDYVLAGYSFADDLNFTVGQDDNQGSDANMGAERDDADMAPDVNLSDDADIVGVEGGANSGDDDNNGYAPGDSCSTH